MLAVGFISSLLASVVILLFAPNVFVWIHTIAKRIGLDTQLNLIGKEHHKIFNNVIALDVSESKFSEIATSFMNHKTNTDFIITNIKEPRWFFEKFEIAINDKNFGHKKAAKELHNLKTLLSSNSIPWDKAITSVGMLIDIFYIKHEIKNIFQHLTPFSYANSSSRTRINFFDANIYDPNSHKTKEFIRRNELCHVFFFEKFINHKVDSYYFNIQEENLYKGKDALILNNKVVLNHDGSIRELYYQNNDLESKIPSGYFKYITRKCKELTDGSIIETKRILERLYGCSI